jgi:hypothetical protein
MHETETLAAVGWADSPKRVKKSAQKQTFPIDFCKSDHDLAKFVSTLYPATLIGSTCMHPMQTPFLDKNQAVTPLFGQKPSHVTLLLESLIQSSSSMNFTVTRLSPQDLETIIDLSAAITPTPFHYIRDESQFLEISSTKVRLTKTNSWTLLGAHDEISSEGTYDFVVTLLVTRERLGQIIVQLHSNRRLLSLVLGLANPATNTTQFPCVYYNLASLANSPAIILLRDYIKSLPRMAYPLQYVESRGGSV